MSALQPMAVYALKVEPGDMIVDAMPGFSAMFRLTMAAIDPTEEPDSVDIDESTFTQRSTLKIIRVNEELIVSDDDSDDYDEDEDDDDLMDEDDEEDVNGGPSDLKKSKRARKLLLREALAAAEDDEENDEDEEMGDDDDDDDDDDEGDAADAAASLAAVAKLSKGKAKAIDGDDEDDSEIESDEGLPLGALTEMTVCTLDTRSHYQQPLDLTIGEDERVFFKVVGSHPVYLTGNYVMPPDITNASLLDNKDDDEYDLSPDEDEEDEELQYLNALADGASESDDLDDLDDPRITEIDSEDENPKLIKSEPTSKKSKSTGKGKNKRPAEDSEDGEPALDDIMANSLKKEDHDLAAEAAPVLNGTDELKKLTKAEKKKLKKLKKNDGTAADLPPSSTTVDGAKDALKTNGTPSMEKKVQFAKNLETGPTPNGNGTPKPAASSSTSKSISIREVQGVTLDDRKIGTGPAAKKGSKLDMRYIGKLEDGKVFDSNKSGKPFSFKVGTGEVIKGWDIGLEGIQVGGERRITIPAHLAYGKKAMPGIPANSKLIFDIKCLGVK